MSQARQVMPAAMVAQTSVKAEAGSSCTFDTRMKLVQKVYEFSILTNVAGTYHCVLASVVKPMNGV